MTATIFQFGGFELDCERFELRRNGRPVRLERKPLELLILLAEADGRLVTRAEIVSRLWGDQVFVDTEHGINTAVRKIRQTLGDDPDHPRFLQTVTGKGYRFVGVAPKADPGGPFVTTVSSSSRVGEHHPDAPRLDSETWASQGATSSSATDPGAPSATNPGAPSATNPGAPSSPAVSSPAKVGSPRTLTLTIAAFALILLAVILAYHRVSAHPAKPQITSLAVLPLDNLSGDPSQDYLADGMTDELTTQIAKDSTLRVISRTSVMQYKHAHQPLPEIARSLNVDGILEGSLARSGDNLHVTVQLIYAPTDTHLWAESYDRNADGLVLLPQDVALTIAKETHSSAASTPPQRYIAPAAHDAFLRGHYLWFSGNDEASGQYFLKAVQIQPDYALAWAGLSSYYGAGAVDFYLDPRTALPLSVAAARKSIELDPSLPEAHLDFAAAVYWLNDWDLEAALNELNRAIELNPNQSEAWHLRSKILVQLNRYQQGVEEQHKAMELTPFERPWGMAYIFLMTRQFDAAITDAKQRIEGNPDPLLWWNLSEAYRAKGMDKESEQALEKALLLWNDPSLESVHRAFARGGRKAVLHWYIDYYKAQAQKRYVSPYLFASYYAQLGDKQHALAWLDEDLRQHSPTILDLQNDTAFDSLHSDPHYRAIVRKIGLPPAW